MVNAEQEECEILWECLMELAIWSGGYLESFLEEKQLWFDLQAE